MNIFTVPAGAPFAQALADELLRRTDGKPEALTPVTILLPTRRACRAVREAFLRSSGGKPLLLPRIQPLGDVDEEELTLVDSEAVTALPPALGATARQILLARAVAKNSANTIPPAQALELAAALGQLMDRIHTENLDMAMLPALAGDEFAQHWQVTLEFLSTLTGAWPQILGTLGMIDASDRRNRLLNALAAHWQKNPPSTSVIAAGTTGSIPATANLLKVIAGLPQGEIVLPGLDQHMDEESWESLDDTHPQATLKHLLGQLAASRASVRIWPGSAANLRAHLATEIMRPAATAQEWARGAAVQGADNIMRCDADTPQEEAKIIALMMRHALETPGNTAALVTPDRALARRVAAICRRWDITVDDSAGQKLADTPVGGFLRLCAAAVTAEFRPSSLLPLLRHSLCGTAARAVVGALECAALRGPKPPPGLAGLRNRLSASDKVAHELLDKVERAVAGFAAAGQYAPFTRFLDAHIVMAETLAGGSDHLWRGEDGTAAALFFADLRGHAAVLPDMNLEDYPAALEQLMKPVTVRPRHGSHPRLSILGQLEARLIQADLVILGGLNEGVWPPDPGHDPWMSRPMMARFGLPSPERAIGLAAHDFVQGFCAPRVVLTRAKRIDGAPAVPARWLQRLDTVLQAADIAPESIQQEGKRWLSLARRMDIAKDIKPAGRPAPTPPVNLRPRKLSVTQIETWLADPYTIYARHVLKLDRLKPVEKQPDAAERGTVLHDAMDGFIKACPGDLPGNAADILRDLGRDLLSRRSDDPGFWEFWWPRFARIADWAAANEKEWRQKGAPLATEVKGSLQIDGFTLTARADRIDRMNDGTLAVLDYKSGGSYTKGAMRSGDQPQLPLEALILQEGGFDSVPKATVSYIGYILLTGGSPPGKVEAIDDDVAGLTAQAKDGLAALIKFYDNPATPYYSLPDSERAPRFNDYEHLARVQEWAALDESTEAA